MAAGSRDKVLYHRPAELAELFEATSVIVGQLVVVQAEEP
jgi:hypothetical protein